MISFWSKRPINQSPIFKRCCACCWTCCCIFLSLLLKCSVYVRNKGYNLPLLLPPVYSHCSLTCKSVQNRDVLHINICCQFQMNHQWIGPNKPLQSCLVSKNIRHQVLWRTLLNVEKLWWTSVGRCKPFSCRRSKMASIPVLASSLFIVNVAEVGWGGTGWSTN